jgi:hypothetical protein
VKIALARYNAQRGGRRGVEIHAKRKKQEKSEIMKRGD